MEHLADAGGVIDLGTSSEAIKVSANLLGPPEYISTEHVYETAYKNGSAPHVVYFWLRRIARGWYELFGGHVGVHTTVYGGFVVQFIIACFLFAFGFGEAALWCGFVALLGNFLLEAVPLTPRPVSSRYMAMEANKWPGAAKLTASFLLVALVVCLIWFLAQYQFNVRAFRDVNVTTPFVIEYLSVVSVGAPVVLFVLVMFYDLYVGVPAYRPINPVYQRVGGKTPLDVVRPIVAANARRYSLRGKAAQADPVTARAATHMADFLAHGGGHFHVT